MVFNCCHYWDEVQSSCAASRPSLGVFGLWVSETGHRRWPVVIPDEGMDSEGRFTGMQTRGFQRTGIFPWEKRPLREGRGMRIRKFKRIQIQVQSPFLLESWSWGSTPTHPCTCLVSGTVRVGSTRKWCTEFGLTFPHWCSQPLHLPPRCPGNHFTKKTSWKCRSWRLV